MKPKTDDLKFRMVNLRFNRGKAIKLKDIFLMVYIASSLHNMFAEYQRKFYNKKLAEQIQKYYRGLKEDIDYGRYQSSNYYEGTGHICLKHKPIKLNFWHY